MPSVVQAGLVLVTLTGLLASFANSGTPELLSKKWLIAP
jgi:hypothetical protein